MKLSRNKIICILGVWVFGFVLNCFGFGVSVNEAKAHAHPQSDTAHTPVAMQSVRVVVAPVLGMQISTTSVECATKGSDIFSLQYATGGFLLIPQDCFSLSLGKVTTQSNLAVWNSASQHSVAVQPSPQESLSLPISLRTVPKANVEVVLPSVHSTSQKTGMLALLTVIVLLSLSRVTQGLSGQLSPAYLQVFRC